MDIQITDRALEKIRETAQQEGVDLREMLLRVAVVPGGCSGLTYDLGWDSTLQPDDRLSELDGLRVVMDKKSFLYIDGTELDVGDDFQILFDHPRSALRFALAYHRALAEGVRSDEHEQAE